MPSDSIYGLTSVVCFSLPVFIILYFRLYRHASLIALMIGYGLTVLRCLESDSLPPEPDFSKGAEVLFSYIEIPLLFSALLFFSTARQRQQKMHLLILCFVVYETVVAALHGFTPYASLYIMIPGLSVIVLYSLFLFLHQLRFTLLHGKNAGLVLMLGALLFSSAFKLLVFYVFIASGAAGLATLHALYFFSATSAAVLMSAGLYLMRHRIRELQELKVTRRELQMVFGG